jgi:hypothetical protein
MCCTFSSKVIVNRVYLTQRRLITHQFFIYRQMVEMETASFSSLAKLLCLAHFFIEWYLVSRTECFHVYEQTGLSLRERGCCGRIPVVLSEVLARQYQLFLSEVVAREYRLFWGRFMRDNSSCFCARLLRKNSRCFWLGLLRKNPKWF